MTVPSQNWEHIKEYWWSSPPQFWAVCCVTCECFHWSIITPLVLMTNRTTVVDSKSIKDQKKHEKYTLLDCRPCPIFIRFHWLRKSCDFCIYPIIYLSHGFRFFIDICVLLPSWSYLFAFVLCHIIVNYQCWYWCKSTVVSFFYTQHVIFQVPCLWYFAQVGCVLFNCILSSWHSLAWLQGCLLVYRLVCRLEFTFLAADAVA